jgi:hypothetical protein
MPPIPQPAFRLHGNDNGVRLNMSRVYAEGEIATGPAAGSTKEAWNGLFDMLIIQMTPRNRSGIGLANPGSFLQNVLVIRANTPYLHNIPGACIELPKNGTTNNPEWPVVVRNTTSVNLTTAANFQNGSWRGIDTTTVATDVTLANNVEYAPLLSAPATADGPFTVTGLFAPYDRGFRLGKGSGRFTLGANVPPGGTVAVPYSAMQMTDHVYTQAQFISDPSRHVHHFVSADYTDAGGFVRTGTYQSMPRYSGDTTPYTLSLAPQIAVQFRANDILVTNNSPDTWLAGRNFDFTFDCRASPAISGPSWNIVNGLPSGQVSLYHPQPGAGAHQAATGSVAASTIAATDLTGAPCGASPSRGALEPAA